MKPIDKLKREIEALYGIEIASKRRTRPYVYARQLFCIVAYRELNSKLTEIGRYIERDHSTVIYMLNTDYNLPTSYHEVALELPKTILQGKALIDLLQDEIEELKSYKYGLLTDNERAYRLLTKSQKAVYDFRCETLLKMI
jgi:hypothetical protein